MSRINYLGCSNETKVWIIEFSSIGSTYIFDYNDVGMVPSHWQIKVELSTLNKMTTKVMKPQISVVRTMLLAWHKWKE